jgi:hypothetical protein
MRLSAVTTSITWATAVQAAAAAAAAGTLTAVAIDGAR